MTASDPNRRRELGLIHVAKSNLALADDSYRAILERVAGVESSAKLDAAGRRKVLDHFKSLGWNPEGARRKRAGDRPRASTWAAPKIRALWLSLYHLGELTDPSESALAAFVKRQTGSDALQWLTPAEANAAIEGLKGWCERVGFIQPADADVSQIATWRRTAGLPETGPGFAAKAALIQRQWDVLIALGAMRTGAWARLDTYLRRWGVAAPHFLAPEDADQVIEALGRWVRAAKAKHGAS